MDDDKRLFSLDCLRGIDMFLLMAIGPVVNAFNSVWPCPSGFMEQFRHAWGSFALWDMIMPLFIFMCGAAVPLALPKRMVDGRAGAAYWRHVGLRFLLLWVLGMICQGNLLSLKPSTFILFSNTLQSIAVGYVLAAHILLVRNRRIRFVLPFVLAGVYSLALICCGDYSQTGNAAYLFETKLQKILPFIGEAGRGHYTWYLTSLMFGAMTLWGQQSTEILRSDRAPWTKAAILGGYGVALLVCGFLLSLFIPVLKHIYTASFTMEAMGYCMIAYAALYALTDILKFRRGLGILILYGQCALFVYMFSALFRGALLAAAGSLTRGLPQFCGKSMPFVNTLVYVVLLTLIVWYYRRARRARPTA